MIHETSPGAFTDILSFHGTLFVWPSGHVSIEIRLRATLIDSLYLLSFWLTVSSPTSHIS